MNSKKTRKDKASKVAKILNNSNASSFQHKHAGSVLSQANLRNQTSATREVLVSRTRASPRYNAMTKSMAGSVLSQSNQKR